MIDLKYGYGVIISTGLPYVCGKLLYDQQDQKLVCHFEQKAFSVQFGIPLLKQDQACAL